MTLIARHIDACLATLGGDGFAPALSALVAELDTDQIMIFALADNHARCLLSRHFSRSALAGRLAARYLDGWFRADPLLPELLALPPGEVRLRRMADFADRMTPEYREIFFQGPGLAGKTTLLAAGRTLRLMVNLYQGRPGAPACDGDLARLVGRLALLHFDRLEDRGLPPPLTALSHRERAVCLGILAGKKAETIAGELGLGATTVVTYRKRAYDKLGIASRAALFAICAS